MLRDFFLLLNSQKDVILIFYVTLSQYFRGVCTKTITSDYIIFA